MINNAGDLGIGLNTIVVTLWAGSAITAKQNVKLDTSQTGEDRVKYVVPDDGSALFVGVALEAQATTGGDVRVAVAGYVEAAVGDGSVASGEPLMPKAGSVFDTHDAGALPMVGVALEDDAPAVDICLSGYGLNLLGMIK